MEIWEELSLKTSLDDLFNIYNKENSFQVELASLINNLYPQNANLEAIEVGSSFGITSALLKNKFNCTLLDIDGNALKLAEQFFSKIKRPVNILNHDMFLFSQVEGQFDLIFNSGVLEHFNFEERVRIFEQMKLKLKDEGKIVIAIPNHFSVPYRAGYKYLKFLNKWIYPEEYKIYDFQKEIEVVKGLKQTTRLTINKATIYNFLPAPLKTVFKLADKVFNFEGYLSVIIIEKER